MPKAARNTTYLSIPPSERFETGCIATFTNGDVRHFVGAGADATRAVAAYCDANGVKVVALSTPSTIHRDLQGTRADLEPVRGDRTGPPRNQVGIPEPVMVSRIGRPDILDERLAFRAGTPHDADRR